MMTKSPRRGQTGAAFFVCDDKRTECGRVDGRRLFIQRVGFKVNPNIWPPPFFEGRSEQSARYIIYSFAGNTSRGLWAIPGSPDLPPRRSRTPNLRLPRPPPAPAQPSP